MLPRSADDRRSSASGSHVIRVENAASPSHEVALFRFLPGTDGVPHVEHGMALPFEAS